MRAAKNDAQRQERRTMIWDIFKNLLATHAEVFGERSEVVISGDENLERQKSSSSRSQLRTNQGQNHVHCVIHLQR
ncbi:hypothetical protein QR680_003182 [Steinernema hermaphroditum]|uniref:Uncharacterized protein n=1 Tax=Steinernema hermaphroditum TaxID=289476 RepID=A0AA39H5Q2_9BILA|nr:hypothetical protein QR680_003182 [Steinernema hermaphroditum]